MLRARNNYKLLLDGSLPANPMNDRRIACCDAQKYFLSTVKSAIIQKYLITEPPESGVKIFVS